MLLTYSEITIPDLSFRFRAHSSIDEKNKKLTRKQVKILHCSGPTHESYNMMLYLFNPVCKLEIGTIILGFRIVKL